MAAREIAGASWLGACPHGAGVRGVAPEAEDVCPACVAAGDAWVHLRACLSCGHVGCCDSSPNQHASKHARAQRHPILRSIEPGEDWSWCMIDEAAFVVKPRLRELEHEEAFPRLTRDLLAVLDAAGERGTFTEGEVLSRAGEVTRAFCVVIPGSLAGYDPQADQEPVRDGARANPEHDLHGLTLWSRQPLEPIEQRCAQLMQTRVGQLHLRTPPPPPGRR